jgi:type IX secretion system PorP/SprF family membrane protein
MKKIYALLLLACPVFLWAQQDVQFTQFMNNRIYYNPAVAGSKDAICINGAYRTQWVGFDGAPVTQNVNINAPIKLLHGGVHLGIVNDVIGNYQNTNFNVGYAFQTELGPGRLGIGASLMIGTRSVSGLWIPSDPPLTGGVDPALLANSAQGVGIDANFGAYYASSTFWGGISTTRVIEAVSEYDAQGIPGGPNTGSTFLTNARHYYIMAGYNYALAGTSLDIQPSLLLKTDFLASPIVDVNVTALYNNRIWGGVTYRLQDAIAVNLGYEFFQGFRAGYSYDFTTSSISGGSSGSHEIMASYCFKIEIPEREKAIYRNPRFL